MSGALLVFALAGNFQYAMQKLQSFALRPHLSWIVAGLFGRLTPNVGANA